MNSIPLGDGANPRSHTILLVDDNEALLRAMQDSLKLSGYDVLTAEDGQAALQLYTQQKEAIDLVITDLEMPRMDGLALLTNLRGQNPKLNVVIMTGQVSFVQTLSHPIHQANLVVTKPFQLRQVMALIKMLLQS